MSKKVDIEKLIPYRRPKPEDRKQVEPPASARRSESEAESKPDEAVVTTSSDIRFPLESLPRSHPEAGSKQVMAITLLKHAAKPGTVEAIVPKRCKMKEGYMMDTREFPRPLVVKPMKTVPQVVHTVWTEKHSQVKLPIKQNTIEVDAEDMSYASTLPRPLDNREVPQIYVRIEEDTSLLPLKQNLPTKRLSWNSTLPKPSFKVDLAPPDRGMDPRMANLLPAKSIISWSTGNLEDSVTPENLMPRKCVMNTERKFGIILPMRTEEVDKPKAWTSEGGSSLPRMQT